MHKSGLANSRLLSSMYWQLQMSPLQNIQLKSMLQFFESNSCSSEDYNCYLKAFFSHNWWWMLIIVVSLFLICALASTIYCIYIRRRRRLPICFACFRYLRKNKKLEFVCGVDPSVDSTKLKMPSIPSSMLKEMPAYPI